MKTLIVSTLIVFTSFLLNKSTKAQTGSVELQTGGGVFISSHAGINDAYSAIPGTVSQAYIIEILSSYNGSTEVFPINLTSRIGSSSLNTITIRPDAGNTGEQIVTSITSNPVIKFNDADYVILDGRPGGAGSSRDLSIQNTSTSNVQANTIQLINGATNNVIKFCNSINSTANVSGPANVFIDFSVSNPTGNSNNLITECNIIGGRTGVRSSGTPANRNINNTVLNNSIYDWGFAGIWHETGTDNLLIEGNIFYQTTGVSVTNPAGINIQSSDVFTINVRKNKFYDIKSTSASSSLTIRGIFTQRRPFPGTLINIENNFISLTADNNNAATTFGIVTGYEASGTSNPYTINILYNSILIGGNQTGGTSGTVVSSGIMKNTDNAGIIYNQKNNICVNYRTGGTAGVIHAGNAISNSGGILDINYNCYYANGSGAYNAMWNITGYNSLSAYQTASASEEQNSRFKNVSFVSAADLHLSGGSIQDPDLSAKPITGITTDIDGILRNVNFPYKGADESTPFILKTLNLSINLEACSPMQDTVSVTIRNAISPYSPVETNKAFLSGTGTAVLQFAKAIDGVNYYVVVNHRNSIETWSKSGGDVFSGGILNYDFTLNSLQAFGSNMVLVGSKYSFYTGDVNQDETIDAGDLSSVENDAGSGLTGYNNTDLNCDDIVDASDLAYCDNNVGYGIIVIKP